MFLLLDEFFGAVIRFLFTVFFGWMAVHHIITPDQGDHFTAEFGKHAAAIAGLVLTLAWSLYQKYRSRVKLLTALESPAGTSEQMVNEKIDNGLGARVSDDKGQVLAGGVLAATGLAFMLIGVWQGAKHGISEAGHFIKAKVGHELKHEPMKIPHALGIHRGHLKEDAGA